MASKIDRSNIDAAYWTDEFMKVADGGADVDWGLMISWFANYRFAVSDPLTAKLTIAREAIEDAPCKCLVFVADPGWGPHPTFMYAYDLPYHANLHRPDCWKADILGVMNAI